MRSEDCASQGNYISAYFGKVCTAKIYLVECEGMNKSEKFTCNVCFESFAISKTFMEHLKSHVSENVEGKN